MVQFESNNTTLNSYIHNECKDKNGMQIKNKNLFSGLDFKKDKKKYKNNQQQEL
jgi:hypothetical protein